MERKTPLAEAITVCRDPDGLYRYWRDPGNAPRFMLRIESVNPAGPDRWHWITREIAGRKFSWDAEITEDVPGEKIAWRSVPGSEVETEGEVTFTKAPGDRGTVVRLRISIVPPGGAAGAAVAKAADFLAGQQLREDLRHFRQLMEAGEIPTTVGQPMGRAGRKAA